jgi:DNA-binding response OmpR family regulator
MTTSVLIVEDEARMAQSLEKGLKMQGFSTSIIADGMLARLAKLTDYDVVILDWMLPGMSGVDILRYWRMEKKWKTPVLMLTAKQETEHKVMGLELGADDYLSKFFEWPELVARLNALVRRTKADFVVGNIIFDPHSQQFVEKKHAVKLSPREFAVLKYFFEHPTKLVTRAHLIGTLYGDEDPDSNVIERHIHALRNKFDYDPIITVRGVGYRLNATKTV